MQIFSFRIVFIFLIGSFCFQDGCNIPYRAVKEKITAVRNMTFNFLIT